MNDRPMHSVMGLGVIDTQKSAIYKVDMAIYGYFMWKGVYVAVTNSISKMDIIDKAKFLRPCHTCTKHHVLPLKYVQLLQ